MVIQVLLYLLSARRRMIPLLLDLLSGDQSPGYCSGKCDLSGNPIWGKRLLSGRSGGSGGLIEGRSNRINLCWVGNYRQSFSGWKFNSIFNGGSNFRDVFIACFGFEWSQPVVKERASITHGVSTDHGYGFNLLHNRRFHRYPNFRCSSTFSQIILVYFFSIYKKDGDCMGVLPFSGGFGNSTFDINGFPRLFLECFMILSRFRE